MLFATENDFHITDLVPSVELVGNIPGTPKDSFRNGNMYVSTNEKVFSPYSPQRHATELRDHKWSWLG